MGFLAVIAIAIGLYLSWKSWKLLRAIADELKIQDDMGLERKWFNAIKEAMRDKVYKDDN